MKARYYVEDKSREWDWLTESFASRREAFRKASVLVNSFDEIYVRIRYRGRVIARWKHGKRVTR